MRAILFLVAGFLPSLAVGQVVPSWNSSGSGRLPRQGISALDVSPDRIALGTIAPAGQPNVIVLDAKDGRVLRTYQVGQRWIESVVLGAGDTVYALCTMPVGTPEDFPNVFICQGTEAKPVEGRFGQNEYPQSVFHYGDHSNHVGVKLGKSGAGAAFLAGDQLLQLPGNARVAFRRPENAVTVTAAFHPGGITAVGLTAKEGEPNLLLFRPGETKPFLTRLADTRAEAPPRPEEGKYGSPTMPNGTRQPLPQRDEPVWAPRSIALYGAPALSRYAVADDQGWQRWVRSSATFGQQNYGLRFMPSRPRVTVYDGEGKELAQFDPAKFPQAAWYDLKFLPGGEQILAVPHSWNCRGLAGRTRLPADAVAREMALLDLRDGSSRVIALMDAIADVDISADGDCAVSCWNGFVYRAKSAESLTSAPNLAVGGPALVRFLGTNLVIGTQDGVIRAMDESSRTLWTTDLNQAVPEIPQPWMASAKAEKLAEGVWEIPGARFNSDMGGQRLIEAPDGYILIEAHAGLSFDREWAAITQAGLDPRKVRYVLATHEHGDHAPGAYLWRVATGAQFICSEEMAYTLQHHLPLGTGYGFHPPNYTDRKIQEDTDLDLAGLKVRAVRLPGHTAGSMGWMFEKNGVRYLATGDLIMPGGVLGYAGSVNFSARDVLASLRKIQSLAPNAILPGHGPTGDPSPYLSGILTGESTGWARMPPEKPNPFFNLPEPAKYQVVGWNQAAASAAVGDLNGDGWPDVATFGSQDSAATGCRVRLFLNRAGKFRAECDWEILLPGLTQPKKIRLRELNGDSRVDIAVCGKDPADHGIVFLLSTPAGNDYDIQRASGAPEGLQIRVADLEGDGTDEILTGRPFGGFQKLGPLANGIRQTDRMEPAVSGAYVDLFPLDLNGDGRVDLASSYGDTFLRGPDGKLVGRPRLELAGNQWTFSAAGDFNGDKMADLFLASNTEDSLAAGFYYANTGNADQPFDRAQAVQVALASTKHPQGRYTLQRDSLATADWNGDGILDVLLAGGQSDQVVVLLGSPTGLVEDKKEVITLDVMVHYDHGLFPADFDRNGKMDLATFGNTWNAGVGGSKDGPTALFILMR